MDAYHAERDRMEHVVQQRSTQQQDKKVKSLDAEDDNTPRKKRKK